MSAKPKLAVQVTNRPTNKLLTGSAVAVGVAEAYAAVMVTYYPPLAGPLFSAVIGGAAAVAVGWFVRDRVNIPVDDGNNAASDLKEMS